MTQAACATGKLEGVRAGAHLAFYGVPYAAAPVGRARFSPPQPAPAWSGVRAAHTRGFASIQTPHPAPGTAASGPQDEDCLNLNIFTPACDGAARPVLFWIHGGAFTHGSGYEPLYDGGALAERGDVVVVTINYRLGALGFLYLGDILPGMTANAGMLDCIAALEWVRDNIAAFGGDPERVTIFGESAGSSAVHALCAMPAARGLFQRAILQSGVCRGVEAETATKAAERVLDALGLRRANADKIFEAPASAILDAQVKATPRGGGLIYAPVIDGVTLLTAPLQAAADGAFAHLDLMIGSNRDETKLFNAMTVREEIGEARLIETVRGQLPQIGEGAARDLIATYRASREAKSLPTSNLDMLDAIQSDLMFRIAATQLAAAQSAHGAAYLYLFTFASPARRGALGACHALELPFVFGTYEQPLQKPFTGTSAAVAPLSAAMMEAWLAFAKTGKPRADWPRYDAAARATLIFDADIRAEHDPFGEERMALEPYVQAVGI